jgi:hypothetical protein
MSTKWVKVAGSDVRQEYAQKRVDHSDGVHWHFEDDLTLPPTERCVPPTILEDHEDGTYTRWTYTVWGPVGMSGTLKPGISVVPISTKADREEVSRIEKLMERALRSQAALVEAMSAAEV